MFQRRTREIGREAAFQRLQTADIVEQPSILGALPPKAHSLSLARPTEWEVQTNGLLYRLQEFRDVVQLENADGCLDVGDISRQIQPDFAALLKAVTNMIDHPYRLDFERKLDAAGFYLVDQQGQPRRLLITQKQYVVLPRPPKVSALATADTVVDVTTIHA